MKPATIEQFYKETGNLVPKGISKEIGHFNVFKINDLINPATKKATMPYNRRSYYKISLIKGRNKAEYADKVIDIEKMGLLFATPRIPYNYVPLDDNQHGAFCIFSTDFFTKSKGGVSIDELPIFQPGSVPVFQLSSEEAAEAESILDKMSRELASDYAFKYDLIRNYIIELIHFGQKLQPATALYPAHTASARVSSLFVELLERQFPIESPGQKITLRTAKDYADRLSVHVNHLNKVLKENTGKTTSDIIGGRIAQEAKILLRQTNWNVSEIAWSLGFEEVAHFSNFFKKQTSVSPVSFRG